MLVNKEDYQLINAKPVDQLQLHTFKDLRLSLASELKEKTARIIRGI